MPSASIYILQKQFYKSLTFLLFAKSLQQKKPANLKPSLQKPCNSPHVHSQIFFLSHVQFSANPLQDDKFLDVLKYFKITPFIEGILDLLLMGYKISLRNLRIVLKFPYLDTTYIRRLQDNLSANSCKFTHKCL